MTRARPLLRCSWLAVIVACTGTAGDPSERAEPKRPERPPVEIKTIGELMNEVDRETALDEIVLACNGGVLREQFAVRSPAELDELTKHAPTSPRLMAIWEIDRSFASDGTHAPASFARLTPMLEAELGQPLPRWWVDQLASGTLLPDDGDGLPFYDVSLTETGDRRGNWQTGPGGTRVRSDGAMLLSETAGQLSYDLSMGRVVLGPLPTEPGMMIEHARARAGTTIYYASFSPGSGGFRFPLHAVGSDGQLKWTTEVCGPDRQILGGLGHLTVEIVVLESGAGIAVFTAESHGVALDVFDPQTGKRTLAWSSDFWFAR